MNMAEIKITITDADGEVFEIVTMQIPKIASLERRDSDIVRAIATDSDGDECSIIDVIHDAAGTQHARLELAARKAAGDSPEPAVPFNNPNPVHNDRRPDHCGMFVAIRSGCWHVGYTTESGENVTQSFGISDITGMRMLFSMWNVRSVRTSSSIEFPRDAGALLRGDEARELLDSALAWS